MIFRILFALFLVGILLIPVNFWVATLRGGHYLLARKILNVIIVLWGIAIFSTMFVVIFTIPM